MQKLERDYMDMSLEQAVALSIVILEWYREKDLKYDRFLTYKERYEFSTTLRHAILELRQYLHSITPEERRRIIAN